MKSYYHAGMIWVIVFIFSLPFFVYQVNAAGGVTCSISRSPNPVGDGGSVDWSVNTNGSSDGMDFGDGSWTTATSGNHKYTSPNSPYDGSYMMTTTCTSGGNVKDAFRIVNVTGPGGTPPPECNDFDSRGNPIDNDGDGFANYPDDGGCTSKDDPTEAGSNNTTNFLWLNVSTYPNYLPWVAACSNNGSYGCTVQQRRGSTGTTSGWSDCKNGACAGQGTWGVVLNPDFSSQWQNCDGTTDSRSGIAGWKNLYVDLGCDTTQTTVATPTFMPWAGTYNADQWVSVTITTTTGGAAIHYTIDGSTPTAASTLYTSPVSVPRTMTIKAIGIKSGMTDSAVGTALYTINQTLTVSLTPNSIPPGNPPPSRNFSADVAGTAVGTINYSFWWDCTNASNSVATVQSACGVLQVPASGTCIETPGVGYKCNGVNADPQVTINHTYAQGTWTAKVIAERDTAAPSEARTAITVVNSPPTASNVSATEPNYCQIGPSAVIRWDYSDPDSDAQSTYQVQVDNNSNFKSPEVDTNKVPANKLSGQARSYSTGGILAFGTTYYARVMVWDALDNASAWQVMTVCNGPGCAGNSLSWTTPVHRYPSSVNFTWTPTTPVINQVVQFDYATTTCYDNANVATACANWTWDFGDGSAPLKGNFPGPTHSYLSPGIKNATLQVQDQQGFTCPTIPISNSITVNDQTVPVWKEVQPR